MLSDVDIIIFDIQDVGVRFYTYISSLGLILQAAKENNKTVVVLDRPNPNAHLVEGPLLKMKHQSFVGMYPIPIVYGLTIGELALMIEGENWLNTKGVDLVFVGMKNYIRNQVEKLTQFPSPNLRSLQAIRAYPWVALFEPTILSVGRGTEDPYSQFGLPDPRMGTATFKPRSDKYQGQVCYGESFSGLALELIPNFTTDYLRKALTLLPNRQVITSEMNRS
jgi:uncharacterized protein YbbC (DUF1343 family)